MTNVVTGMVNALSDHNGQILELNLKTCTEKYLTSLFIVYCFLDFKHILLQEVQNIHYKNNKNGSLVGNC